MLSLEIRPDDRIHLKLTDTVPVFHVEIDIASKTPKQGEHQTDYYPHDVVDAKIRKIRSNTRDNEPSGQIEQEQSTPTENDAHQTTAHGATGHQRTSAENQMIFVSPKHQFIACRAMNSVSPENTFNSQVVHENNRDTQKNKTNLSDQEALPTHVKFENQFLQQLYKNIERLEEFYSKCTLTEQTKSFTNKQ